MTEPEFPEDVDETEDDLNLDAMLAAARPERYGAKDKEWMEPTIEARAAELARRPVTAVLLRNARTEVHRREGEAVKRSNRFLRQIALDGQMPTGWGDGDKWKVTLFEDLRLPFAIADQKVRLGVLTAEDLEQWELHSSREQDRDVELRTEARKGAALLAKWLKQQGQLHVEDLGPSA